ncbi:siderophore-interacting protein [Streptomyces radicis]|uniref:Siderophore-interacting protein n=1 Tax=Streptomyces radicis TaxID=1750517 RepID=A0A3A9VSM9_9ACTN|nr:siderophore-interacting protein [Streptomyces radicis]RKN04025.1 siderophore-interacting protein [Streptomyces radicis]RKN14196.1 siderophore-interacting protein [Streptomyces radicis]
MTTAPFAFFDLRVLRAAPISPGFIRVTLGGERLSHFACGGRDQRVKLFLPHPGQREVLVPRDEGLNWWPAWQRLDPGERATMRTYTVREQRREPDELDIDFALHGDTGVACRWARRAVPGDPVTVLGPVEEDNGGVDFRPPADADWVLITGDATALPAVAGILAWLPPGTRTRVWLEVDHAEDVQELPTKADAEITWLLPGHRTTAPDAIRAADLPAGSPYAWLGGEAATVRALRRHLVNDRGFDRKRVTFTGYWRRGVSEEDLINEAIAAEAA